MKYHLYVDSASYGIFLSSVQLLIVFSHKWHFILSQPGVSPPLFDLPSIPPCRVDSLPVSGCSPTDQESLLGWRVHEHSCSTPPSEPHWPNGGAVSMTDLQTGSWQPKHGNGTQILGARRACGFHCAPPSGQAWACRSVWLWWPSQRAGSGLGSCGYWNGPEAGIRRDCWRRAVNRVEDWAASDTVAGDHRRQLDVFKYNRCPVKWGTFILLLQIHYKD